MQGMKVAAVDEVQRYWEAKVMDGPNMQFDAKVFKEWGGLTKKGINDSNEEG